MTTVTRRAGSVLRTMVCATLALTAGQASAATFTPADAAGLVAAINTANGNTQSDTIDLGGQVFTLAVVDNILDGPNGLPAVLPDGGSTLTIQNGTIERDPAAPSFRFLRVAAGAVLVLEDTTLREGDSSDAGGAIYNLGTLTVSRCLIARSHGAGVGGGIANLGTLTVVDSTLSRNSATGAGGAIDNQGTATIAGSTLSDNFADIQGGALYNSWQGGVVTIRNSTISGNHSAAGSAIYNTSAITAMTNVTVAGNTFWPGPGGNGEPIVNGAFATIYQLESCVVAGNSGGARPDIANSGTILSSHSNLIGVGDGSGIVDGVDGNQVGSLAAPLDPLLGPLQDNGGPTFTHAPLTGSLAIDAGSNPAALANDQRGPGFSRVSGAQADVGAFELQSADVSVTKVDTPDPVTAGERLTYTITVQNAGPDTATTVGLSDTLPAGTTFVSLSAPGGWSCTTPAVGANGTVGCSIAAFPVGSATFTIVVTVDWLTPVGTVLWNAATLYSVTPDPDSEDRSSTVTTTVVSPARLSATKAVSGSYRPGGTVIYAIDLRNAGPGMQLDNPGDELVDVLPAELALVSASANSGTVVATVGTNTVTWNGTLVAGGVTTITIRATVRAGTLPGASVTNQASIAYDLDGNGTNEASGTSDDPATTTAGDPTTFVALAEPTIPAVGDLGLALLGLLVAIGGALVTGRRVA